MIDPRLHVLRVLAERGTVTAAAEALNYTPSAVSHQLRSLARDLAVTLLVHEGRGVRLTPAAQILVAHADELYTRWEEMRADVQRGSDQELGTLRLSGFSTGAAALLPYAAKTVCAQRPRLTVQIIEADPEECFDLLLTGDADIAVVVATDSLPPSIDPRFDQRPLLDDPLDLLVPADHRLAGWSSVPLEEAADELWIGDRPGRPHHQLVLTACASAGFTPAIVHHVAEWDTGAALVGAGFGVALVPRLARLPSGYPVARVPLRGDPSPARHILTAVRRGSRGQPVIAEALRALEEVANRNRLPRLG
ncbi:LysR family transcriptional regulator [Segeticoccus rhizosphaerae]|jgi:DNA-binding transcriptional LysR family regulator|uniref:LysR family transcriptional regulator n=1 Tax=Segeticoccus rhizosphaerae TaxID=1104777 RepID=UPI0010BF6E8E|nr:MULTISPECIES: LysR family transcriptional regulator [Intrasporangiaceae]